MFLLNAFSLNMLATLEATVTVREVDVMWVKAHEGALESAVGHAETAAVFSSALGFHIPPNRATVSLSPGERAIVGQYVGPRLPEGCTVLPDGAMIRWCLVTIG